MGYPILCRPSARAFSTSPALVQTPTPPDGPGFGSRLARAAPLRDSSGHSLSPFFDVGSFSHGHGLHNSRLFLESAADNLEEVSWDDPEDTSLNMRTE